MIYCLRFAGVIGLLSLSEVSAAGWFCGGSEALATKENNEEHHKRQDIVISHPTCLHPNPWGGDTLAEMLEVRNNCLNSFLTTFSIEIGTLNKKGLFAGKVKDYDSKIMLILHKIFTNEGCGENLSNIPLAFKQYPDDFFRDMDDLWRLIKSRESQSSPEVTAQLEKMLSPFVAVRWCATYYWNHRATYIQSLKSGE